MTGVCLRQMDPVLLVQVDQLPVTVQTAQGGPD